MRGSKRAATPNADSKPATVARRDDTESLGAGDAATRVKRQREPLDPFGDAKRQCLDIPEAILAHLEELGDDLKDETPEVALDPA